MQINNYRPQECLGMNFYKADSPSFESRIEFFFLCLLNLNIWTKILGTSAGFKLLRLGSGELSLIVIFHVVKLQTY